MHATGVELARSRWEVSGLALEALRDEQRWDPWPQRVTTPSPWFGLTGWLMPYRSWHSQGSAPGQGGEEAVQRKRAFRKVAPSISLQVFCEIGCLKTLKKNKKNDFAWHFHWQYIKIRKKWPGDIKSEPKGAKRKPNDAKRTPKGAKREPKGAKREPKVSQRVTKMHPKIKLRKRSRKGCSRGLRIRWKWCHFGSHFPLKIDEKIDAEIDAEKVMKIDEKSMRKWYRNWLNIYLKIGRLRKVPNAK